MQKLFIFISVDVKISSNRMGVSVVEWARDWVG